MPRYTFIESTLDTACRCLSFALRDAERRSGLEGVTDDLTAIRAEILRVQQDLTRSKPRRALGVVPQVP